MSIWKKIANEAWEEAGCQTSEDRGGHGLSKVAKRIKRAINKSAARGEERLAYKDAQDQS